MISLLKEGKEMTTEVKVPRFDISVQLSGEDGNAFAIMGKVSKGLKYAGATKEEVAQYTEESMAGDYDNLLQVAMAWVNVE